MRMQVVRGYILNQSLSFSRFDKHVEAFGRGRMEAEVASLRARRDKVSRQTRNWCDNGKK